VLQGSISFAAEKPTDTSTRKLNLIGKQKVKLLVRLITHGAIKSYYAVEL
jgi:hypothetical protein